MANTSSRCKHATQVNAQTRRIALFIYFFFFSLTTTSQAEITVSLSHN